MTRKVIKLLLIILLVIPLVSIFLLPYDLKKFSGIENLLITSELSVYTLVISLLLGVTSAIILSITNIKFKSVFIKLLLLPILFPPYAMTILIDENFSNIRGMTSASISLALSLYPYVLLITYSSFKSVSSSYFETIECFNLSRFKHIYKLVYPSLILSSIVVLSDVFSDFGVSTYNGLDTIMVRSYELWFIGFDKVLASNLIFASSIIILILFQIKLKLIDYKILYNPPSSEEPFEYRLNKYSLFFSYLFLILVILVSVVIPLYTTLSLMDKFKFDLIDETINTLTISGSVTLIILIISITMIYLFKNSNKIKLINMFNYSVPGLIISIGLMNIVTINNVYVSYGLLVIALTVKYLSLMTSSLESHTNRINRQLYYAAKSEGKTSFWFITRVQIPMTKDSLILGSSLIFLELVRELPITLILRPINFDLLSTKLYFSFETEMLSKMASPIILMIVLSIIPTIFIIRKVR